MAALWGNEATLKLIQLWGEDNIQAQLKGCKRNAQVFTKIASEMKEAGYERTGTHCRDKIKKLRGEYRKIVDKHGKTGEGRKRWTFFEAMDSILGHKPATCPPHVVDTSRSSETDDRVATDSDEGEKFENTESGAEDEQQNDGEVGDKSKQSNPLPVTKAAEKGGDMSSESSRCSTPVPPTKKCKLSKTERVEKTVKDLVGCIIEKQMEEEDKYLKIEERRLDLEEKMAERESQYRKNMLEFQKQMFSTLAGIMTQWTGLMPQQPPLYPMMPLQETPAHPSYGHGQYYGSSEYSQD